MIPAARFLVESTDRERWLAARAGGVTATMVALAATPAGFKEVAANIGTPDVHVEGNPYFDFGNEQEVEMMRYAHQAHGILPNRWLIASDNPAHLATPDGLSLDHTQIAECKTTGTDWKTPPAKYRRQVQWQLHVTGADSCLFLWQLRVPDDQNYFYPAWLEPKATWIARDDEMIADLIGVADRLMEVRDGATVQRAA
jgi:hypothetical protein